MTELSWIDRDRTATIDNGFGDDQIVHDSLTPENVIDLIEGRVSAIRVPNYISKEVAQKMVDHVLSSASLDAYTHEIYNGSVPEQKYYGVYRIGVSFNTTYGRPHGSTEHQAYYEAALPGLRRFRELCAPNLTPIDRLRLDLDEVWEHGASVAAFEGRKMFVGIVRVMPPEDSHILDDKPHVDCLQAQICHLDQQLSANIYLKMPPPGGALHTWNVPTLAYDEIEQLPDGTIPRADLPRPIEIHPQERDLVLINTRKPHAVGRFSGGIRISAQAFIGYRRGESLKLWC